MEKLKNLILPVVRACMAPAAVLFMAVSCGKDSPSEPAPGPEPEPEPEVPAYNIEVGNVTTWSAEISVAAEDPAAAYWCGAVSRHVYDSLGSDAALVEMEVRKLKEVADLYDMDYSSYVGTKVRKGDCLLAVDGFMAETDYYAFAFTFSDDFMSGSDVCRTLFTTSKVQAVECSFDISVGNVTKSGAEIKIVPSDQSCTYFCDYVTMAEYRNYGGDDGVAAANVSLIRRAVEIYKMAGYDKSFSDFLNSGTVVARPADLVSGADYAVFAFGLDPSGTVTTEVAVKEFHTEDPEPSSLTFRTELFDLKFNGAKIGFTPSNDEEKYFTDCMDYETFSKFGSEQEVIAWVLSQAGSSISSFLAQGYHVVDASDLLVSETRYVAYAFGYDNGATTGLTTVEFTTPAMPTGSGVSVKVDWQLVDAGTLNPSYEGSTALYVTLTPSPAAEHWFAGMFTALDGYAENDVIEALQARGYKDKKNLAFIVEPGKTYILAAVAVDPSGTAGALTRIDVEVSPASSALRAMSPVQPPEPVPVLPESVQARLESVLCGTLKPLVGFHSAAFDVVK